MMPKRPVIRDLQRSRADIVLEVLALVALLVLIGLPYYYYPHLPDSIPQHFNIKGEPDGWGGKGSVVLLPIIGLILYVALTVLSRFPHVFNYPWAITEENARRQYLLSRRLVSAMKLSMVLMFAYISWSTIATAQGSQSGLSPFFTLSSVPVLFGILGLYVYAASRAR
jgi:uncharacterized membrane protein